MRILLTGGTGLIGTRLRELLVARGDQVLVHTRKPRKPQPGIVWLEGDASSAKTFAVAIGTVDAVINLAGAPIATRWTSQAKAAIIHSRVQTTLALVAALNQSTHKPRTWLNASAVGFYGSEPHQQCDESTGCGTGFLAEVCGAWEAAAQGVKSQGVRLVIPRLGIVLAAQGGILPLFIRAAKAMVGGPVGSGEQWMSWIHLDDAARMMLWALDNPEVVGPINTVAPNPAKQHELLARLGRLLHRPMWLKVPPWAMKALMGEMAQELILASQQVVPREALGKGFSYTYPHLEASLKDLITSR